jgi:cytidine deaminase
VTLLEKAQAALANSYAPYSKFRVGCAVEAESGKVYVGCNVENSSFGATVCAERVAIWSAVAAGERKLKRLALVNSSNESVAPCGLCRQVLSEFGDSTTEIEMAAVAAKTSKKLTLSEIFPYAFDRSCLGS